jgi:hypothetical protein
METDGYEDMTHAYILKDKGLTRFTIKNGNVTWSLIE